jgi:hypothetical protein
MLATDGLVRFTALALARRLRQLVQTLSASAFGRPKRPPRRHVSFCKEGRSVAAQNAYEAAKPSGCTRTIEKWMDARKLPRVIATHRE